jgi:hypothetical protein
MHIREAFLCTARFQIFCFNVGYSPFSLGISLHIRRADLSMQRNLGVRKCDGGADSLDGTGGLAGRIGRNYRLRNVLSRNYWLCNEEVLVVLGLESGLSWVSEIGLRDG